MPDVSSTRTTRSLWQCAICGGRWSQKDGTDPQTHRPGCPNAKLDDKIEVSDAPLSTQRPEDDVPFATIIAPFDECGNCGSKASESATWNRTGGWACAACGESDYPEAAE